MKAFFYLLASICLLGQISLALSSELYGTANLTLATFLITAIALLKPNAALAFFLFALPIFGNKPGTFQAQSLMALSLAITFALSLKVALADKKSEKLISGNAALACRPIPVAGLRQAHCSSRRWGQ